MVIIGRMDLNTYLKSLSDEDARVAFAARCDNHSIGHLRNVGYGYKPCGHKLAAAIFRESGGAVTREELCPKDYWLVWPDLPAPEQVEAGQGA